LVIRRLRVAGVNIWAERTAVYAYEALVVGVGTMIVEVIFNKSVKKDETKNSK